MTTIRDFTITLLVGQGPEEAFHAITKTDGKIGRLLVKAYQI